MRFVEHSFPPAQDDPLSRAGGLAWLRQLCPECFAQSQEIRPPDIGPRVFFENRA
jgi:hypothetical protein